MNRAAATDIIQEKADSFAHGAYTLARKLPKEELFGLSSQLRCAALPVPLDIVEGYARQSRKSQAQFLRISYGSLKESQYILQFAVDEGYVSDSDIASICACGEEVVKLLWAKTRTLEG